MDELPPGDDLDGERLEPIELPPPPRRADRTVTTSELTKLVAGRYQRLAMLPRRNDTALHCSESLSPGRAITPLEEALVVYGTVVLRLPQEAQRVLLPPAASGAAPAPRAAAPVVLPGSRGSDQDKLKVIQWWLDTGATGGLAVKQGFERLREQGFGIPDLGNFEAHGWKEFITVLYALVHPLVEAAAAPAAESSGAAGSSDDAGSAGSGAAASSGANLWDQLLPFFAEEKWLTRTMRRFIEPERDRITIPLGTLGDVLRTNGKSALAAKLMTVMSGVAKSAQEASHWGEEQMTLYDQSVICTLPGHAVEGFRAYGLAPNGKAEVAAAPRRGTVELEAGSAQRRPAQDWHFDFEARAVAGSWQLALAHERFLVPPSSLLAPLGGQGPKLIRKLHVAPYRTFPGNASEAKGTRCLRASFADAFGNMREPVATVAEIPTGSFAWFSGAHAGDAMPAGAGAMLALFARVRSSGLAAEPNVQNLFRCHFEQDAYFEIPHQFPPQYGFAAHQSVQVPRFSADGLLRWAWHSDRGAAWRPVRKTPPAHLPCTCLHSPLQHMHMHMHMLRDLVPLAAHAHAHAHTRSLSVGRRARGVSRLRRRRQWRLRRR